MNRFIILFFMIGLYGCSKSLDIQLAPEAQMYFFHDANQKITITEQDEVYVALKKWLAENKSGWFAASGSYAGGVYVKSGNYGIQVTQTKVIIYSTESKEPKAIYAQGIDRGELNTVLKYTP